MSDDKTPDKNLNNPETWKESGNEFFNKGLYEDAAKCYSHAIELNPEYIDAWNNLGLSLLKLGRTEEANVCNSKIKELKLKLSSETKITSQSKEKLISSNQSQNEFPEDNSIIQTEINPAIIKKPIDPGFLPKKIALFSVVLVLIGFPLASLFEIFIFIGIIGIFGLFIAYLIYTLNVYETGYKITAIFMLLVPLLPNLLMGFHNGIAYLFGGFIGLFLMIWVFLFIINKIKAKFFFNPKNNPELLFAYAYMIIMFFLTTAMMAAFSFGMAGNI